MVSPLSSSFILELSCPCSQSISLPDVSLSSLLLLRATLEMGGVSRWLDSLAPAESLLAVLTTLGGNCSLQMDTGWWSTRSSSPWVGRTWSTS